MLEQLAWASRRIHAVPRSTTIAHFRQHHLLPPGKVARINPADDAHEPMRSCGHGSVENLRFSTMHDQTRVADAACRFRGLFISSTMESKQRGPVAE